MLPDTPSVRLSRPTPRRRGVPPLDVRINPARIECAVRTFAAPTPNDHRRSALDRKSAEPCSPDTSSVRLSRPTPRRKAFRLSTPDQARAAWIGASVRRWTRPDGAGAMTETPGSAVEETRGGAPDVIYLPDQRQRTKKVTSGSENRQRSTAIRVRVPHRPMPSACKAEAAGGRHRALPVIS